MIAPNPLSNQDLIVFRPTAGAAEAFTGKADGQSRMMDNPATFQDSYSTCRMPDSKTGVSLLEATYPGVMDRPEGERMRNFAEAILEAGKCYIQIEVRKYRNESLKPRFIANLSLMWGGIGQAPREAKGSWYLGSAGADMHSDMWQQIAVAVGGHEPLPYKAVREAVKGNLSCP